MDSSMSEQDEMTAAVLPPSAYTEFDWLEDYNHENGHYSNTCAECECTFIGHKRRVQCKMCFDHFVRHLTEQNRLLVEAGENLRNEAHGLVSLNEELLRSVVGNTNINCLKRRIAETEAALAAVKGGEK